MRTREALTFEPCCSTLALLLKREALSANHPIPILRFLTQVKGVEPSGVQALKNPNPFKDVEALVVLVVAVLF